MLLELNRPAEALDEYEKSLTIDPNRFNALYGAGEALELIGNSEQAKVYFDQLQRNFPAAHSQRPELVHAHEVAGQSDY